VTALFISDLHLDPARPDITSQCLDFLDAEARHARSLYILGDLFEAWIGDDDPEPEKQRVAERLAEVSSGGTQLFFMHGNRDFLVGPDFARQTGCLLLEDPTVVELFGQRVLLMHGDTLCTDDVEYQAFRAMVRDPAWQAAFLSRSLEERAALALSAREQSQAASAGKPSEIMDVNANTVADVMRRHQVSLLLHGHTHRPAVHHFELDGRQATRIVLGDWHEQGSALRWDASGYELLTLPR
jgi:UDP-2,3-diacylglucosamine hydrolase